MMTKMKMKKKTIIIPSDGQKKHKVFQIVVKPVRKYKNKYSEYCQTSWFEMLLV